MITSIDQISEKIQLQNFPERIVSLVPSQTELLYDFGLNEQVKGITKFCTMPASWFHQKIKIGGTKNLNIKKIRDLGPDLIFANKEENEKDQVELLREIAPVWTSDVSDLVSALRMITSIGELTGRKNKSDQIVKVISENFSNLKQAQYKPSVAYLIWYDPIMVAGGDCFINDMISKAGFRNCFSDQSRYPKIDIEEIRQFSPELIFLSSEPFPFSEKHKREFELLFPASAIVLVAGEMFSWYGSRLLYAPAYFRTLHVPALDV
ncbi:helical backbone metal receptor [Pollutibacter soli]|uniref:ABC transporter substrate-binding protein n=1 Tax=Pollutibacter soli TaxID=3034157 RepID=UPI003013BF48